MAAFPLFMELEGKSCLVVGGGQVAFRKARTLCAYGACVTVVAKQVLSAFYELGSVTVTVRAFVPEDLEGMQLVFVAVDDAACSVRVAALCREKRIPVNVADVPKLCDFYFPALVRRGKVVVGVSTGGESPALAAGLRRKIDSLLPQDLSENEEEMAKMRRALLAAGKNPAEDETYMRMTEECL